MHNRRAPAKCSDHIELAGGRPDLLAEVAGIFEGASDGELDEPLARQAAHLCRVAGADETLIPQWIGEGHTPGRGRPYATAQRTAQESAALCPPMRGRMVMTAGHPLEIGGGGPADRCHTFHDQAL